MSSLQTNVSPKTEMGPDFDARVIEAIQNLKAQQVVALNAFKASLLSTVRDTISHQNKEIEALKSDLEALRASSSRASPSASIPLQSPPPPRRETHISQWWRLIFFTFALLPSLTSLFGYLTKNNHAAYISLVFWNFSAVCLEICVLTSPQRYKSKREKAKIVVLGLMFGLSPLLSSLTLLSSEHKQTKLISWFILGHGCSWIVVMPLSWLGLAKIYSKMSETKLSQSLLAIFKSQFGVLCTLLYVNATPLHCILKVSPNSGLNILDECGNPVFNTIWVSLAIFIAWHVGYIINPIIGRGALRWADIMAFNLSFIEGIQFVFCVTLAISAMVLFASIDPTGSGFDEFMQVFTILFLFSAGSLLALLGFEYIFLPVMRRIFRGGSEGSVRMTGGSSENGGLDFKETSGISLGVVF